MKPIRPMTTGEYHYGGGEPWDGAVVYGINKDDTYTIKWCHPTGHESIVQNVPLYNNADDGVHFFRPFVD